MKKIAIYALTIALFIACGDKDEEDFDPTRVDLVTGMLIVTSQGQVLEEWGNPNLPNNQRANIFPKPAPEVIRVVTNDPIKNIWIVPGFPTRRFADTNFQEVFAQNSYDTGEIQSSSTRSLENISGTDISINLQGLSAGYYRMFVQFQDDSLTWDNFYAAGTVPLVLEDINFWND